MYQVTALGLHIVQNTFLLEESGGKQVFCTLDNTLLTLVAYFVSVPQEVAELLVSERGRPCMLDGGRVLPP